MYCRSLIMYGRFALKTSNIPSGYLIASCNNHLLFSYQQHNRCLAQNTSDKQQPGRIRRFFRWLTRKTEPRSPMTSTVSYPKPLTTTQRSIEPTTSLTTMQRIKRFLALAPWIEQFLLRSRLINDEDLARLLSKIAAITIYTVIGITVLGTFGVDTKPLLAGLGITGFTIGFALKEVATNFISGVFLVINKPFVRGCRIKIHGGGGGIEGLVHYIDVRYVHLKTQDRGIVMIPSSVVYTNPFTVFPADDDANPGFIDMTKPSESDATKLPEQSSSSSPSSSTKDKDLKMNFDVEPAGSFKKAPFSQKL